MEGVPRDNPPPGAFVNAGAGVKTNFFIESRPTEKTWYYDLADIKVGRVYSKATTDNEI